ncbi:hypothetical protein K493DRAFT_316602 [Basidiobolus meristosporus CBS 931.73]|uniref:Cyclin N-terminal domain-containing protein n=1 Tax=Basidiobolus meristosporus CBS 931.73 TaxID=1314790 RepID=A0A1Y1Y349_9FUNG|nr:hypothetical protein K493DRAFT_316602 [Basidiobolus meristosporus CBS 931.73]|eukprot:ORX92409.1 hypothetical protein K493DRAFT_316602 [Basidiobolus meristosporus CBS 931.73]
MGTKRKNQRKEQRREQSLKDKDEALRKAASQISDPLGEYRLFIRRLRSYGMSAEDYTHIPLNLIDFTATMIASMITGENFLLPYLQPINVFDPSGVLPLEMDLSAVNFIRRILNKTQLSCTSLILALFFVDRLKSESNQTYQSARRRSRRCLYDDDVSQARKSTLETNEQSNAPRWSTVPMFLASVIVADKYLSDATYTNEDWAEFTCGKFSLKEINDMERRFLSQLNYNLYVTEEMYEAFLSYIEVSLSLNQIYRRDVLSYKDVSILSQSLLPEYINRLNLSLRPLDAMILLGKMLSAICLFYVAAVASMAATCQYASMMIHIQHSPIVVSPPFLPVYYPTSHLSWTPAPFANISTAHDPRFVVDSHTPESLFLHGLGNSSTHPICSNFPSNFAPHGYSQPLCGLS